ncbi:bifunctional phosphopantothenoylcysteine decarboxylase/phosphopantothenate--cysteine ligase CoaBC [Inmirania thermothiophila]|uniref:Coenzyme A biosynthesis bifunctional protein CoaBC n=1 Tax=Inmirania thermothiophila TaxID=1750597 RepID=A0A3N1Y6M6_9GAMM|nr:bifunctional phosphopantothenoylcysteine decarboxylase/phosphopantothenate--cysteine ligase CoaBC [Inmirania thermothiophila]ROR34476.1 phosphopantothenoylcysteine decarboxylase/phosphopantothenate--cysteine ligase [Inmirania thermothiophila]
MSALAGRRIVLGVSGGVAAYKAAELARELVRAGAEVDAVLTRGATAFVTPLLFQAVTGRPAREALLDPQAEAGMGHIELARRADLVLVAPATAHLLARLAHGLADDLLTTLCLATRAPLALAPAMNAAMWAHPATQDNVARLRARGAHVLGPAEGALACGEEGPGRMLEPAEIAAAVQGLLERGPLAGLRVLVTAGPTREAIDPVRYISNRSSGRMGYAVAQACREAGAEVVLVSGPTALAPPPGVRLVRVESAAEMLAAVEAEVDACAIFIAAAAVADYRPAETAPAKIKKRAQRLGLELVRNPDILATVARRRPRPFVVGFAAETEAVEANARAKLAAKGLDLVAANRVGPGIGFDREDNELTLIWEDGAEPLGRASKLELARRLVARIAERHGARDPAADPGSAPRP